MMQQNYRSLSGRNRKIIIVMLLKLVLGFSCVLQAQSGFKSTTALTQPKVVKIVGSGGFQGLEPYQSGFLISGQGHILTVWSYVLDNDVVTATLNDGQRFDAKLVGYDPRIEIAILKIDAEGTPNFVLDESIPANAGTRILAFSNLYGVATGNEPASVQLGIVSARTKLSARKGASKSMYQGDVYVLDAITNNPGAAGGAITDRKGRLVGVIGKEVRDTQTGAWLNFCIPIEKISESVNRILDGQTVVDLPDSIRKPSEPMTLDLAGFVLVPNIVSRTPPFVDRVLVGKAAAEAGLMEDDLIIEINGRLTPSIRDFREQLEYIDRDDLLKLTIQRGREFKSIEINANR